MNEVAMSDSRADGRVAAGAGWAVEAEWDPFVPSHFEEVHVGRTGDEASMARPAPAAARPPSASIVQLAS
jgi:hypothetical protein